MEMDMNSTRSDLARIASALTIAFSLAWPAQAADPVPAQPDPATITRGAKAWADNCVRCHNLREPAEFRDDQWRIIMSHMRIRAGLTGQEARDVLKFLQQGN
jgi:mono/diheme cytochrome c family protein